MSTVVCAHLSEIHLNDHHSYHICAINNDQRMMLESNANKDDERTKSSSKIVSNVMGEDEHCQICGDMASGWHCG